MAFRAISFGYKLDLGKLIIIEEEARIVKQIFKDYLGGKGLAQIATELKDCKIEYAPGCSDWNKNRVSRLIENKRYIGANGYPILIQEADFEQANSQKKEKGNQKKILPEENEFIKGIIYCSSCGGRLFRRSDIKYWKCRNECLKGIKLSDDVILDGIKQVIELCHHNQDLLNVADKTTYIPTQEILRQTNEIHRMTDNPVSFNSVKQMIFKTATQKFDCCTENGNIYTSYVLEKTVEVHQKEMVDIDYLKQVIRKIFVNKDGSIKVQFLNGAVIENKGKGGEQVC